MNKVANIPEVVQRFEKMLIKPNAGSAADFHRSVETELTRWRSVTKNLKLGTP